MKNLFLFSCFLLITNIIQGQDPLTPTNKAKLTWGPVFEMKDRVNEFVAHDEKGFYTLNVMAVTFGRSYYTLSHFDQTQTLTKSVKIELEHDKEERDFEGIIYMGRELYVLSSFTDKSADRKILYVQDVDKETLDLNSNIKKLAEIDLETGRKKKSGFNWDISSDSSKVLIYYDTPYTKNESEKFGLHVFDNTFTEIWNDEITLPYTDQLFKVDEIIVSPDGDAFVLGQLWKDKSERERKEVNYKYIALSYESNGTDKQEYEIDLDGNFVQNLSMMLTKQNEIMCAGFYSTSGSTNIGGSFFLKIDRATKQVMTKSIEPFDISFITQSMSDKKAKKTKNKAEKGKDVELFSYVLRELILREDGGVVLLGEQYFKREVSYTDSQGNMKTRTNYYYNDIIAVNISPEGKIEWAEKILKLQSTSQDDGYYSSFVSFVKDDKIFLVFNDNPENLNYSGKGPVKPVKWKEAIGILVEIDSDGRVFREPLFGPKEKDIRLRPKVSKQVSKDVLMLYGERKKKRGFLKAEFK